VQNERAAFSALDNGGEPRGIVVKEINRAPYDIFNRSEAIAAGTVGGEYEPLDVSRVSGPPRDHGLDSPQPKFLKGAKISDRGTSLEARRIAVERGPVSLRAEEMVLSA
jgi:hypothetical protein